MAKMSFLQAILIQFRNDFSYLIVGGRQIDLILPTSMCKSFRNKSTSKEILYIDFLKLENLQAILKGDPRSLAIAKIKSEERV